MDNQIKTRLLRAISKFDEVSSRKRGPNPHAMQLNMLAYYSIEEMVDDGESLEAALNDNFSGMLLDFLKNSVGIKPDTIKTKTYILQPARRCVTTSD